MFTKDAGRQRAEVHAYRDGGVRVQGMVRAPARRSTRDASGPARRTVVARFQGTGFVAEREDDELVIYLVSDDPIETQTTGDRGMSAARLQRINEASRR